MNNDLFMEDEYKVIIDSDVFLLLRGRLQELGVSKCLEK
jgi:hypothetical protein